MIFSAEKLRVQDLHTLVESEPPADRTRPLEWRRSFNRLRFQASSFSIDSTHWINEADCLLGKIKKDSHPENEFPAVIKSAIKTKLSISTNISFEDIEDCFYKTTEVDKEQRLFTVREGSRAKNLVVTLSEGEPQSENWHSFCAGAYYGNAMFLEEDGDLLLDLTANKEVLSDIIKAISSGSLEKVLFNAAISSFSYEVDDFLREPHDRRDLLIHGFSTPAALEAIVIKTRGEYSRNTSSRSITTETIGDKDTLDNPVTVESGNLSPQKANVVLDKSSLRSIGFALWALVVMLFLIVLK
jgi:hypothetical protein